MACEFGTIVLVPFPFADHTASMRRPAVIVSSRPYNLARPDVVVMAVTSQLRASPALGEVWISQWERAGLLKPSAIKPVFATIEQRLVIRECKIARNNDPTANEAYRLDPTTLNRIAGGRFSRPTVTSPGR